MNVISLLGVTDAFQALIMGYCAQYLQPAISAIATWADSEGAIHCMTRRQHTFQG